MVVTISSQKYVNNCSHLAGFVLAYFIIKILLNALKLLVLRNWFIINFA